MRKPSRLICSLVLFIVTLSTTWCSAHNVFIVVIDGVRYTESFGAKAKYMPHVWNDLRPQGTIYTHFRNEGKTLTNPGHAAMLTGNWQNIANDGSEEFQDPSLFELFRKQTGLPEQSCFVIAGKEKLHILTHSSDTSYGSRYMASFKTNKSGKNIDTWKTLDSVMTEFHPRAVMVNFAETDIIGHEGKWKPYLGAIREVDSLLWVLWNAIQSDSVYKNTTTLFVTNDHGRHDDQHGGFRSHGDSCEGCRHIMLLALGPKFKRGAKVSGVATQVDIAPTSAEILGIEFPKVSGKSLVRRDSRTDK
jgi:membrane-anchored protein YejM (alkaline phosphatase superfamily)